MKTVLLFALLLIAIPHAGHARFVTLTVGGDSNATMTIREFETAHVVSGRDAHRYYQLEVRKTNAIIRFSATELMGIHPAGAGGYPWNDIFVTGPAELVLRSNYPDRPPATVDAAYVTIEVVPEGFPPDKTIVIPQGGGANIALECSTNLIDWTAAPLGVYTNQPTVKFFRLKAERLP